MGRPRKTLSASDPFIDLSRKTEILEREMSAQREAIERLKRFGQLRAQPLKMRDESQRGLAKRRVSR